MTVAAPLLPPLQDTSVLDVDAPSAATNAAVTVQLALIAPVVNDEVVLVVPPQPEIVFSSYPEFGEAVHVVEPPGDTDVRTQVSVP